MHVDYIMALFPIQLQRATSLPKSEQTSLVSFCYFFFALFIDPQMESIVQTKQAEVSFNTSWLENFYEEQIMETYGKHNHVVCT